MVKGKRILSVSLALAIVLGLFAGATFVSNAFGLEDSYIISSANSKIVHADTGKKDALTATAGAVTDAEAFKIVNNSDGTVSILCKLTDSYIAPHDNGHSELVTNKNNSFTDWQKFELEQQLDGTVAIKSVKTNKYVTVDLGNDATLAASSATVGNNEKFTIVTPKTPEAPADVAISSKTLDSVSFTWSADSNVANYNIYRSSTADGLYEKVNTTSVAANNYTDEGLTPITGYFYKVSAVNLLGESAKSAAISVITLSAAPTGLTAGPSTNNSASLTWADTTGATGYNVYRSSAGDGTYTKINTVPVTTAAYTDTGLIEGTVNYYKVSAVSEGGESALSSYINLNTFPSVPAGLDISSNTPDSLTISWAAAGATSYNIYRAPSRFADFVKINTDPVTTASYTDTGLTNTGYCYKLEAVNEFGKSEISTPISLDIKLFGLNAYVFAPTDDPSQVQKACSDVFVRQESAQFGTERYALLFKPGTYDSSIQFNVGFYTHVAGLGKLPTDTVISRMTVNANWNYNPSTNNYNATTNFWRTIENITLNSNTMWAVSQAAPMRRLQINGTATFDHYGGWASGGFMADSVVTGEAGSPSQQQWFTRNSNASAWTGVNWNYELVGTNGTTPTKTDGSLTVVPNASVTREKPFLYFDKSGYNVFVPGVISNLKGTSWSAGDMGPGVSMPISSFYVAKPADTAAIINAQLNAGKSLIFTPGIYNIDQTIHVTKPDTIVLGLGLASIVPQNGITAMIVDDVDGVSVSGLIFDAGRDTGSGVKMSPYLMQVGQSKSTARHSSDPIWLSDLFFRVGGAGMAQADTCLEINANDVIGDDFWLWRADHGSGVGWNQNISNYGLVVNGDNMTMYGLFSEHFEKYASLWNGENGKTYFFQNELPYDVPSQGDWMNPSGRNGYAAYKVADTVNNHEAWGLGVYAVFIRNNGAPVTLDSAIEVPNKDGVVIRNACTVNLSGTSNQSSQITNIVNNYGASTNRTTFSTSYITGYSCPKPTPVIDTAAYDGGYHVTITPPEGIPADANIYYTLDGSIPTINSTKYIGTFDVIDDGVTKTLRAAVITTIYQQPSIPGAATLTFAPLTPMQITVQKGVLPGDILNNSSSSLSTPVNPITITIANAGYYDSIRYIIGNTLNTATDGSPVVNGTISIVPDRVQGATNYTIKAFKGVKATVITIPVSYSLAIGAPTVTSSVTSTNVGANVVDSIVGSTGQSNITRWESAYTGTNSGPTYKDEYIYIDLGANYNIGRVVLQWWSTNSIGRDFTIDVAPDGTTDKDLNDRDNSCWINAVKVVGMNNSSSYYTWDTAKSAAVYGNPGTYINGFSSNTYKARYIRMRGTKNGAGLTSSGFSISDFAVFGTPAP